MQSRHALLWLFAAQLMAILPRLDVLPVWLLMLWGAMAYWHWQIVRGRASFPGSWLKLLLAAMTVAAIYWQFKRLMNLEAMLAILICAVSLKLLELKSSRDHWLLLLLCYFIVASGFLFSQQIGMMLVALGQIALVMMAQQAMHRQQHQVATIHKLAFCTRYMDDLWNPLVDKEKFQTILKKIYLEWLTKSEDENGRQW